MIRVKAGFFLALLLLFGVVTPSRADSIGPVVLGITNNPCGNGTCVPTNTNIATVSAVQNANLTSVTFTVQDFPNFSTQIQSNNFFEFNTNIIPLTSLSLDGGVVTVFSGAGSTTVKTKVNETVVGQSGTGHFSFGLDDLGAPPTICAPNCQTVVGVSKFVFTIDLTGPATVNGQTINQLRASNFYPQPNAQNFNFEMHFCDSSSPSCNAPTGFVVDSGTPGPPPSIPEPGSLALMGTGIVGVLRVCWRRYSIS